MKKSTNVHVYNRNELGHNKSKKVDFDTNYNKRLRIPGYNKDYQLFSSYIQRQPRYEWTREVACQCYIRKNMKGYGGPLREEVVFYSGLSRQPYAYSRTRSYTDVGVGNVTIQQKKRVRKIYLPETENRGVGSEDLTSFITTERRPRYGKEDGYTRNGREDYSHYAKFPKKISKCVGGVVENIKQCSEKLSPIICFNQSKSTSPNETEEEIRVRKDTANNTINKNMANNTTQVESTYEKTKSSSNRMRKDSDKVKVMEHIDKIKSVKSPVKKLQYNNSLQKSSDSLEQHVHNLENPSFIPSTGSSDPMENKLEKEYRKMFSNKNKDDKANTDKPINDMKSTSVLRRRFEALRRGIVKKDDAKKNAPTASKESSPGAESSGIQSSATVQSGTVANGANPIQVDISVESDPPSLEARSYSHTKLFSPAPSAYKYDRRSKNASRKKSPTVKKEKESIHWSPSDKNKSDESDVQGMFKVWGEKFNFEEGKSPQTGVTFDSKPKEPGIHIRDDEPKTESLEKKEGKRFFFFKKKSKDKPKSPCKSKKGVTAGRCEVKNCLPTSTPASAKPQHPPEEKPKIIPKKSEEIDEIIKKNWLQKFIQRTIESRKSLQIRWNNKTYAASSSTVFELMDNVYRQTEIIIRSQSETSTGASSYYQSYNRHHVNFVQDIEAWMVPKLIQEREVPYRFHRKDAIHDRKWFIDKSKAFAHKIELVLHSKNFVKCHRAMSSEYLRIDIPKGFFTDLSSDSDRFATSNSEEVYKIVEYENPESRSDLKFKVKNGIGDHLNDNANITKKVSVRDKNIDTQVIETVIKKPPIHRDVVIQGSNVHIPKRCDVIGVGIITHRDIRELRKPIMKIEDDVYEEESEHAVVNNIKQCEFAESYLREYYRNWMPLGIDLFPSRASDVYVKCESLETLSSHNNQGDATKSCPNLKDYHSPENLNPASSNSYPYKDSNIDKVKIFNTFKSLTQPEHLETKRILPKDSFEVLKKRMMYACGNKANWNCADDQPYSVPSLEDKAEQDALQEIPQTPFNKNKKCKKRVSITNCDQLYPCGDDPISVHEPPNEKDAKQLAGILSFCKKNTSDTKHATVREDNNCDILPPPCKEFCATAKDPNCSISKPKPKPNKPPNKPSPNKTPHKTSPNKSSSESSASSQKSCPMPMCPPGRVSEVSYSSPKHTSLHARPPKSLECRNVCSCTCTPKKSSSFISSTDSPDTLPDLTLVETVPPTKKINTNSKPCPCSPEYSKLKKLPKIQPKLCTCSPKKKPSVPKTHMATRNSNKSPPESRQTIRPPAVTNSTDCSTSSTSKTSSDSAKQQHNCQSTSTKKPSSTSTSDPEQSAAASSGGCLVGTKKPPKKNCKKVQKNLGSPNSYKTPSQTQTSGSECCQKCHSQSSNTCTSRDSPKSIQVEQNPPKICPGSPCPTRLADLTEKAKSMPKIQGLHLKKKPNPPPLKCVGNCPAAKEIKSEKKKSPGTEIVKHCNSSNDKEYSTNQCPPNMKSVSDEKIMTRVKEGTESKKKSEKNKCPNTANVKHCNSSNDKEYSNNQCPPNIKSSVSDEKIMIRVKERTESTEEIRESLNLKVKDADGRTLYERRDYQKDCNREIHKPQVLGEMYKVNRLSTKTSDSAISIEKLPTKNENHENTKSDASLANMIEISFGLKVMQAEKIAEINLTDDKDEEIDKSQLKCKVEKSHEIFMVTGETEPITDEPNDKNDINIKIVIKNFKSKSEKSGKKQKNNDFFAEKISQKFHTVSTGYSDVLHDQIDNIYLNHRTTVDLTTSKSQLKDKIEDTNNSGTNTKDIQSKEEIAAVTLQKEITYSKTETCDEISNLKDSKANTKDIQSKEEIAAILLQKEITYSKTETCEEIINLKVEDEEIKKSIENTLISETNDKTKKVESDKSINRIRSCADLKTTKSGKTLENDQGIEKRETISKISKTHTYSILQAFETKETIHNTEKDEVIDKMPRSEAKMPNENETDETINRTELFEIQENKANFGEIMQNTVNYETEKNDILEQKEYCCEMRTIRKSELLVSRSETEEKLHSIENYESISEKNSHVDKIESNKLIQENVIETIIQPENTINDVLISETIQIVENWQSLSALEEIEGEKPDISEANKNQKLENEKEKATNEFHEEIKKFENFLQMQKRFQFPTDFYKPIEITADVDNTNEIKIIDTTTVTKAKESVYNVTDITQYKCNTEPEKEQKVKKPELNIGCSETLLSPTDTDQNLANTSDEVCDKTTEMKKPHTKREKKDMLKHVFEKATSQKWKSKGRMKCLRNMLKLILTSDSSEVEEAVATSKGLVKEVTCFSPKEFKYTDSMTNYYRVENVVPSDDENNLNEIHPTPDKSEDDRYSDSSDLQPKSTCLCKTMAKRLKKVGERSVAGCCCRAAPVKVHEQTSCEMNTDMGLYIKYKAAEYIDVQTQNSIFNSEIANVMLMKQMKNVMTSKTSSDVESVKINTTVSPYRADKECEVKNTNTMLGLTDDGKIVIRTSDENKLSLQTEIVIGWKEREKKKKKKRDTYFATPADILQSYETKKAVLEIYTEKTVSEEGERLIAKLPKFVYEKEEEIEENYVKNVLLARES